MANEFRRLLKSISNSSIITLVFMLQIELIRESILTFKVRVNAAKKNICTKNQLNNTYDISQLNFTLIQSVISSVKITFLECQRCAIWSSITGIGDFTHISNAALALEPFWCGTLAVPWWLIKMVIISNVRK